MNQMHVDPTSPEFATNKIGVQRVADAINALLNGRRTEWVALPEVAIATAYFNPAGFNLLADELEQVGQVRLLLGADPAETAHKPHVRPLTDGRSRRRRAGPDPEVSRALEDHTRTLETDRNLVGFTRPADAAARRLVAWLRTSADVEVRRYENGFLHGKAFIVERDGVAKGVLAGSSNFTFAGLARNNELNLGQYQPSAVGPVMDWFNEQWDAATPYDLAGLFEARWIPHQPYDVFLRMLWELYGADLAEDTRTSSQLGLTQFQADGVWRARRILARRRGVLVADEVGLGKTFLAGELIHEAVFERRQKVLVIAPATLRDSTWLPFLAQRNLRADVVSFEELVADVDDAGSRTARVQQLDEYALVIVDEAHGLRSARTRRADAVRQVLAGAVPKDLVLLTATPVNNSLEDLYNLISYFAPNDAAFADIGIPSLRRYFNDAIATNPDDLSPEQLFDVLDEVAVRRTRKFVKDFYAGDRVVVDGVEQMITFPTPRVIRVDYQLEDVLPHLFTDLAVALGATSHDDLDPDGSQSGVNTSNPGTVFSMARYVPSKFRRGGATQQYETQNAGLIRTMLLKRFESSAYAFKQTLEVMITSHERFLAALRKGLVLTADALREWASADSEDVEAFFDDLDQNDQIDVAADYDADALDAAVTCDLELLRAFRDRVDDVAADDDPKLAALIEQLASIAEQAEREGIGTGDTRNKRKALIFTYYADTAAYLHEALEVALATDLRLAAYKGRFASIHGGERSDRARIITGFAPLTAGTGVEDDVYDLLVATDVLAEGVNLQQARHIINYDLPWNPMRLVQRHGRIDRIGSPHREVFLRCFFPVAELNTMLELEERLQRKLKQAAASIGVPRVLPGVDPVERNLSETRDQIDRLRHEDTLLFEENSAALSGEEYRRQLSAAISHPDTEQRVLTLPWGSGAGLERGNTPGIVFCARIADHPRPWLRYVALNSDLTVATTAATTEKAVNPGDGAAVLDDTLACLDHADPRDPTTPPVLSDAMYQAAFDAWSAARDDIYRQWTHQTDPANLAPPIPRAMREAATFIAEHGGFLGGEQEQLRARFNAPYVVRIQREVRNVLNGSGSTTERVQALQTVANRYNLIQPPPPRPMPPIELDDIHLICWVAISPETAQAICRSE